MSYFEEKAKSISESFEGFVEVFQAYLKPSILAITSFVLFGVIYGYIKKPDHYLVICIGVLIGLFVVFSILAWIKPMKHCRGGRYFVGIDLGRFKIEYCLIDYKKFKKNPHTGIVYGQQKKTRDSFDDNYKLLEGIIDEISKEATLRGVNRINGIGVGLPGQVNPREGTLLSSPGFNHAVNKVFVNDFKGQLQSGLRGRIKHTEILRGNFPIKVDNDVRCATRYLKEKNQNLKDGICILVGNGLGSGIVLDGRILYGHNFMAGEIGHTTICCSVCCEGGNLLRGVQCSCATKGYHWEIYASSRGMANIAKRLDENEYRRLKDNYKEIIREPHYDKLLEDDQFGNHKREHLDKTGELTSYFFSLAYHTRDEYIRMVVDKFLEFLAVGIANYINVINPEIVYLGGGMINGFFNDNDHVDTIIQDKVKEFVLRPARNVTIKTLGKGNDPSASIGAALIFKDDSYPH